MGKDNKKGKRSCRSSKAAMLAFGVTTLGTRVIAAISLAAIALGFCSIKKEATAFNECVAEMENTGKSSSDAVHFCNGGK